MCLFQSFLRYKKSPCADHKRQHRAIPVMRRLQWSRSGMPTFWMMTAGSTQQGSRRSFMAAANRRQRQEVRQASTDPLQDLDAAAKQQLLLKLLAESPDMATLLTALTGRGA